VEKSDSNPSRQGGQEPGSWLKKNGASVAIFAISVGLIIAFFLTYFSGGEGNKPVAGDDPSQHKTRQFAQLNPANPNQVVAQYWDALDPEVARLRADSGDATNIRSVDYAGSDTCKKCHSDVHDHWSASHHTISYAKATPETVKGDFSENASIEYLGGKARFIRDGDAFLMQLERDGLRRVYQVTGTLGGRKVQAYSGKLIVGPRANERLFKVKEIQLPFNYWVEKGQWIPPIHPGGVAVPDDERADPFGAEGFLVNFEKNCALCHTTRPIGDWMISDSGKDRIVHHANRPLGFLLGPYMQENHQNIVSPNSLLRDTPDELIKEILAEMDNVSVEVGSTSPNISCEACHHGCLQHATTASIDDGKRVNARPTHYFPVSPLLITRKLEKEEPLEVAKKRIWGNNADNVNFMCARCHTDARPLYANGMSTWHGAAATDASRGHCYLAKDGSTATHGQLTCVQCHDPHKGTGEALIETPQQQDARCITCHQEFEDSGFVDAHTHHKTGTAGSHCMDCHMPKVVEGRDGLTRTHMIFSPTDKEMLGGNQPNACNLCHLDESIDWTVKHLKDWYRAEESDAAVVEEETLASNYPQRDGKVGLGWLRSYHGPTRLVAIESLCKANARWALDDLLNSLDDQIMANRMFAQINLEKMLGMSFDEFGYRFYMTPSERREPIEKIRAKVLSDDAKAGAAGDES